MNPKSVLGKTEKYSGVVKSVKKTQQPEEPKITKEEVQHAFSSFNFPINDRGHNDILYWTTRGKSELPKLIEELHKKRLDIIKQEDDSHKAIIDKGKADQKAAEDKRKIEEDRVKQHNESRVTLPRLNDQDLAALFDEYGLPAPDPEWARSHLPNDPKKIRSILELQRKTADDMLKKHAKNTVNSMPEVPKMQNMPMQQPAAPMMGMGGPSSPLGMAGDMSGGDQPTTPFFIGDSAVVRITSPTNPNMSTLWLVDPKKKVLQPFISEQAFQNAFEDPTEAERSIVTISSKDLGPGGALDGFELLKGTQGVGHDGTRNNVEFSKAQIQNRYGKQSDPTAEGKSLSLLDGVLGGLNKKQ